MVIAAEKTKPFPRVYIDRRNRKEKYMEQRREYITQIKEILMDQYHAPEKMADRFIEMCSLDAIFKKYPEMMEADPEWITYSIVSQIAERGKMKKYIEKVKQVLINDYYATEEQAEAFIKQVALRDILQRDPGQMKADPEWIAFQLVSQTIERKKKEE